MSASEGNHDSSHGPEAPPEPKTPMWLPAVGGVLFLVVGLLWALSTPTKEPQPSKAPAAADAGAPQPH